MSGPDRPSAQPHRAGPRWGSTGVRGPLRGLSPGVNLRGSLVTGHRIETRSSSWLASRRPLRGDRRRRLGSRASLRGRCPERARYPGQTSGATSKKTWWKVPNCGSTSAVGPMSRVLPSYARRSGCHGRARARAPRSRRTRCGGARIDRLRRARRQRSSRQRHCRPTGRAWRDRRSSRREPPHPHRARPRHAPRAEAPRSACSRAGLRAYRRR